jgi:hypothetical protein
MFTLARAVRLATVVAVGLIVAGILLHVLDANMSNGIVSAINDAAKWLVQPFDNVFHVSGAKANIAVNWGLAALVYAIAGMLIARTMARYAAYSRMRHPWRNDPAV